MAIELSWNTTCFAMTTWKAFKVDPTKLYLLFIIKHNHVYKHDRHISSTFVCWNWNCNLSKQTMIAINDSSNTRHFRKTTNNFTKHYLHNIYFIFNCKQNKVFALSITREFSVGECVMSGTFRKLRRGHIYELVI